MSATENDQGARPHRRAEYCQFTVLIVFDEFSYLSPISPQKSNYCTLLFLDIYGKRSGHVVATSGGRQLNDEFKTREVLCLRMRVHAGETDWSQEDTWISRETLWVTLAYQCTNGFTFFYIYFRIAVGTKKLLTHWTVEVWLFCRTELTTRTYYKPTLLVWLLCRTDSI
jgi:hypothetical protein